MNETLILLPGATPDDPVRWAFVGESDILASDASENIVALASIADRAAQARMVACVLRGEAAAMRSLPAPPKSAAQFRAAAGFLLEDELAENLDQVHVATTRHESGAGIALAIKKSEIDLWRTALADAGIQPDMMTADFALLPLTPGRAIIVETPDRIIGAAGLKGFALERPLADQLLPAMLADEDLRKIVVCASRPLPVGEREGVEVERNGALSPDALIGLYAEALERGQSPNFLQGAYRRRRDWRSSVGPWRRASMLAAACAAAFLISGVADAVRSLRIADDIRKETLELHRAAFPDAAAENPRDYARRILSSSANRPAFISLTNAIAQSAAATQGIEIERIRYSAARGEYAVNLRFADIAQFEALKRALEGQGVAASETGSVRRSGGQYFGELQVGAS